MLRFSFRALAALGVLALLAAAPAWAQTYCLTPVPTVAYYPPVPTVAYYPAPPAVSYYAPPTVAYYPAPTVTYYPAPAVAVAPPVSVATYRYGILPRRRVVVTNYYYSPAVVYPAYVP